MEQHWRPGQQGGSDHHLANHRCQHISTLALHIFIVMMMVMMMVMVVMMVMMMVIVLMFEHFRESRVEAAFKKFDKNEDGFLDWAEFQQVPQLLSTVKFILTRHRVQ